MHRRFCYLAQNLYLKIHAGIALLIGTKLIVLAGQNSVENIANTNCGDHAIEYQDRQTKGYKIHAKGNPLRHSYATIAIEFGDDLKTVQKTLGHATEGFTLKAYTHVTEKMKNQSAERMERRLILRAGSSILS